MTLFFDRNVGVRLPRALHRLGMDVTWHDEHFAPTTSDEEWLTEAGRRGWIVITHDTKIAVNQSERRAVIDAGVQCFVLDSGSARPWVKALTLGAAWAKITAVLNKEPPPFIWQRRPARGWIRLYP